MSLIIDTISDVNHYGLDFKNREIYLNSFIGNSEDDPGVDYRMAGIFYKNIRLLDSANQQPIIIHMHSMGGHWNDGMAIFDAISTARSFVTIVVYGQAESMSSIILQAADNRVMMPNSYFMCHYGSSSPEGNYLDVQKAVLFEKRDVELMLNIYAANIVKGQHMKENYKNPDEEKAKNFLKRKLKDGDWYLDAEDAVHYGFADHVIKSKRFPTIDSLK